MKKAIKQKLLNLITINPIDYCVKTNLSSRHIDILKYVKNDIFISFIKNEISQLEISTASSVGFFEEEIQKTNSFEEFISVIDENGFILSDTQINSLKNDFIGNKKRISNHFINEMKSSKKIFISLNRIAKQFYNDKAIWPLHISYQFIKGKLASGMSVKAPLIIKKVEIIEEGSKLFLRALEEEYVVNEKIQVIMNKEFPSDINRDDLFKFFPLQERIEMFSKMVSYDIDYKKDICENFLKEDAKYIIENYPTLRVEPSAILGVFEPGGSALKQDLEKIIEEEIDPFESQMDGSNFKSIKYYEDKVIKNSDILEINRPLNIFQKYAVSSALQQSTLIYGPPGTGKSEVIANIVSNVLIKGKNVLMISEKKAALDVLTSRINSLSQFTLYLCDIRNKENFYKKIESLNTLLGTQWYREPSKYSRNAKIEPLKMDKNELMFYNNYKDWYNELTTLVKKHWDIEDFKDSIFNMDYLEYQNLKDEIGEQLCSEWLQSVYIEDKGNTTLHEYIQQILLNYNISKIDDFFDEYLKYKKFVRKFKLEEEMSSSEIIKNLKKIKQKISNNNKLVESFLLGGKKLNKLFDLFFEFKEKYGISKEYNDFLEKTSLQKDNFINSIEGYLNFKKRLFQKKPEYKEFQKEKFVIISNLCFEFKNKYKKEIEKNNWLDFFEENGRKIEKFLEEFNNASEEKSKQEIIFAEFVVNKKVISDIEQCELPLKVVKNMIKNIDENIDMFNDFVKNIEVLESEFVEDFIKFEQFFYFENEFLVELFKIKEVFIKTNQSILKEYSWLSLPYIKALYLENYIFFDLEKMSHVMQHITRPIDQETFLKLRNVGLWNDIVKNVPKFLEIKGLHLQDIIYQLRKEANRSASIVEELIFKKYINSLRNYLVKLSKDDKDEIANVLRIASSGNTPPITQFVRKYYSSLKKLFPVWVARPDNVADMVPLNQDEFDYGIFDEASQMSIERSYPLVYRTKIKVVSGDDKQLKPSSFFMNKTTDTEYDLDDFDSVESLLERAKVSWWNEFHLKNHYRSESKELIEFSNKFIYNGNLEIATKCGVFEKGIEVIDVNGLWDSYNRDEANKVVELLLEHHATYEKILVVTFNSKQSLLIESLLLEKSSTFPELLREKIESNNIVITNLENVQGNEGDLVILSISYGRNKEETVRNNFGPLNAKGGSNRLNVAITRAKSKMIILKSLNGDDIRVANANNKNAIIFKKFIEYLDIIKQNQTIDVVNEEMEDVEAINEGTQELDLNPKKDKKTEISHDFSSKIVKNIYGDLIKSLSSRYDLIPDFKVGSKNIDLLIINKKTKKVLKALIIEQWKSNRTIKEMVEEIDRQYFLEDREYSTFKIKEYEWHIDKNRIIEKLKNSLVYNSKTKVDYIIWQNEK